MERMMDEMFTRQDSQGLTQWLLSLATDICSNRGGDPPSFGFDVITSALKETVLYSTVNVTRQE